MYKMEDWLHGNKFPGYRIRSQRLHILLGTFKSHSPSDSCIVTCGLHFIQSSTIQTYILDLPSSPLAVPSFYSWSRLARPYSKCHPQ